MTALQLRPAHALRRTIPAYWAHLGPMDVQIDAGHIKRCGEFMTLRDLAPRRPGGWTCNLNGEFVSRRDWWRPVRVGDIVVFQEHADGGDSDWGRTLLQIVILIAAVWTGGAVGAAYGQTAGALASAAVAIGGNLLLNALMPLQAAQGINGGALAPSSTYSITLQANQARLGAPRAVRYGQEFYFPDYAAPPYAEYDGENDQYFCAVYELGLGQHNVLRVSIDDTDIRNFDDVQFAICGPGQSARSTTFARYETLAEQSLVDPGIVTASEVSGQELIGLGWLGAFSPVREGRRLVQIIIDVMAPRGLGAFQPDGSITTYGVTWQVAARPINDYNQPTGAWSVIAVENITAASSTAIRRSYAYTMASGRYQVRMRRLTGRDPAQNILNDFAWIGLRAKLDGDGIVDQGDATYLVVRVRANEQLSGLSQRRIGVLSQRYIPVWNGSAWSAPQFTRNPAHCWADILHDATYGRGLPNARIDLANMLLQADVHDDRQDHFDYSFDARSTVLDAANVVAAAGRSATIVRRGVYTLVRDEQQSVPVAVYMPRTMDKDSFAINYLIPSSKTPDAVKCRYRDGQVWDERIVYGQIHDGQVYAYAATPQGVPLRPAGVPEPSEVIERSLPGVIGQKHALREAIFIAATSLYCRETGTFRTGLDGLLPAFGSLVATAHDVAQWGGQSGDVVHWDADTLTLTTDEPLAWTAGQTHYLRLQDDTGAPGEAIEATAGASDVEMVLAHAPSFTPHTADADRERTRWMFGSLAEVTDYAVVTGIRLQGERDVQLAITRENNLRHTADSYLLPAEGEIQDALSDGSGFTPGDATDYVVNVDDDNGIYEPDGSADNRIGVYEFRSDGTLYIQLRSTNEYLLPYQWLGQNPVTTAISGLFEIRAHVVSGALGGSSAPADTWLSLATTRRFEPAAGDPCVFTVEIRDVATQTLQDSAGLRMDP
jgi:hypothetical protein